MRQELTISKTYIITNNILNKLIKKKYGNHISVRMNSLVFVENREAIFSLQPAIIIEEISLKSTKRISLNELQKIKSFLVYQLSTILMVLGVNNFDSTINVRLLIV